MTDEDKTNEEEEVDEQTETRDEDAEKRLAELEEKASRVEELEKQLEEKENELRKYSSKEFNFKKFRESKQAERDEMLKKYSEKEKMLIENQSKLEEEVYSLRSERLDEAKTNFLSKVGADDELKSKLEDAVKKANMYMGEPKTPKEVIERYQEAYLLLKSKSSVNPLNEFKPVTSHVEGEGKKRFTDSAEGRSLLKNTFGIDLDKGK